MLGCDYPFGSAIWAVWQHKALNKDYSTEGGNQALRAELEPKRERNDRVATVIFDV